MYQAPGTESARILVTLGVPRADAIDALMREIGLTHAEAERAWWSTAPGHQEDLSVRV